MSQIDPFQFYTQYHGHPLQDLYVLQSSARKAGTPVIYLVGDSSLDNKHWLFTGNKSASQITTAAPQNVSHVFNPARNIQDIAYWMNTLVPKATCINAAVEESTLNDRKGGLLPHDAFVRDTITENDYLIVSVGGNDIALKPSIATMASLTALVTTPSFLLDKGIAPGMTHFQKMFGEQVESYVEKLVAKHKPRKVLICMIYFPDENSKARSWASTTLSLLGYNRNPSKLQAIIRKVYETATKRIIIKDVDTKHIPLFSILDGKESSEYKERVEPSITGGLKMAQLFADEINSLSPQPESFGSVPIYSFKGTTHASNPKHPKRPGGGTTNRPKLLPSLQTRRA